MIMHFLEINLDEYSFSLAALELSGAPRELFSQARCACFSKLHGDFDAHGHQA